ncbi:MAG: ABC transporter permease [Chloroflexi bacterium]|nr:ABC transporter permease [Chloroflexota bacterium]
MMQWPQLFRSGVRASWANLSVELTPAVIFASRIPRTVLQALFFILLAYAAGGSELAKFALIGNMMHTAVFHGVVEMSFVIELEKYLGTMPYLIASPANWFPMMLGRSLTGYIEGLVRVVLVLIFLFPFFGMGISAIDLLRAVPLFLITLATTSALGWLSGAITLPTRWGALVSNTIGYLMMVLCGINFPFSVLPPAVQWMGRALPMTHGLLATRAVLDGAPYADVAGLMAIEIAIGLIYGAVAWILFAHRLNVARQTGNIEQF